MGLIITGEMTRGTSPTERVSPFYFAVEKDKLSRPYLIPFSQRCYVEGTMLEVKNRWRELSQDEREIVDKYVKGKKVEFYLSMALVGSYDYLYFTEDSWAILRDAGIIGGDYTLSVRLIKAKIGEEAKELYPLRDIA